jgi:hypothetical protein
MANDKSSQKPRDKMWNLTRSPVSLCELPIAESQITAWASYPETSVVVDFFRPLLLRLTVWR